MKGSSSAGPPLHILLVDTQAPARPALADVLRAEYRVSVVLTGEEGIHVLKQDPPALIIIDAGDQNLPILSLFEEYDKQIPLLLVGHHAGNEYVGEGFQRSALKMWLEHTIAARHLKEQVSDLGHTTISPHQFGDFITCSPQFVEIFRILTRVALADVPILITGESGTGKELIARGIHDVSGRKGQPFVSINCAAIPEQLLETELFGHEKGAFTGATATKIGKLEYASGGTVFLDEIGDMPLALQAKILRVLQERVWERVGSHQSLSFKARIVAATNKRLQEEVQRRTFREDLLYRLNTVHIELPPLRDRRNDIPLLIEHFLKTFSQRNGKRILGISPLVLSTLQKYDWPGNVRELVNTVQHGVLLADGLRIELKDLPAIFQHGLKATIILDQLGTLPLNQLVEQAKEELERQIILSALEKMKYNKWRCAYYLGIDRKTLYRKMKALHIADQGHAHSQDAASNG